LIRNIFALLDNPEQLISLLSGWQSATRILVAWHGLPIRVDVVERRSPAELAS
jgi:hypothetical protein